MVGIVPCLTRTRAGCGGYWITGVDSLPTTREMLRLQGLPECLTTIAETAAVSERQLCQMIGNAMSVNAWWQFQAGCFQPWDSPKPILSSLRHSHKGALAWVGASPEDRWGRWPSLIDVMLKSVAREDALSLPTLEHSSIGPGTKKSAEPACGWLRAVAGLLQTLATVCRLWAALGTATMRTNNRLGWAQCSRT